MTLDLPNLTLGVGSHSDRAEGVCFAEAVAWVAGEAHSDHPKCMSPVVGAHVRALNDVLPDDKRQRLVPLIPATVGTAGDGYDEERGYLALDWLVRVYVPTWLRAAGVDEQADALTALAPITSPEMADAAVAAFHAAQAAAGVAVVRADQAAWAARGAVGAAAWDAAQDVAQDVAQDAARVAAGAAARGVAGVARDVAWDAAWAGAQAAAQAAAQVPARSTARAAARAAARGAARDTLAPTVEALQDSAVDLLARMIGAAE